MTFHHILFRRHLQTAGSLSDDMNLTDDDDDDDDAVWQEDDGNSSYSGW